MGIQAKINGLKPGMKGLKSGESFGKFPGITTMFASQLCLFLPQSCLFGHFSFSEYMSVVETKTPPEELMKKAKDKIENMLPGMFFGGVPESKFPEYMSVRPFPTNLISTFSCNYLIKKKT
jgi:hypothetical protein